MADINVPAFPPPLMPLDGITVELSKLAPVAGQVLVIQCPPTASLDQVLHVLSHINQNVPDGVHVACVDSDYHLMVTNVPEVVVMLQKPEITH